MATEWVKKIKYYKFLWFFLTFFVQNHQLDFFHEGLNQQLVFIKFTSTVWFILKKMLLITWNLEREISCAEKFQILYFMICFFFSFDCLKTTVKIPFMSIWIDGFLFVEKHRKIWFCLLLMQNWETGIAEK